MNIEKFLKTIFLFESLKPEDLRDIATGCQLVRLAKEEPLFQEGASAQYFYVIAYGKIGVYKLSPNGTETTLHMMEDRDIIAEAAIYGMNVYPASAKALADSTLIAVPASHYVELILSHPQNALKVMSSYSLKLKEFVTMIEFYAKFYYL